MEVVAAKALMEYLDLVAVVVLVVDRKEMVAELVVLAERLPIIQEEMVAEVEVLVDTLAMVEQVHLPQHQ